MLFQRIDEVDSMPTRMLRGVPNLIGSSRVSHSFEMNFIAVSKSSGHSVPCRIAIGTPRKMAGLSGAYEASLILEGPEALSREMKGAHPFQVLELAMFAVRTVLAFNATEWTYESTDGQPLDFSYSWPDTD